MTDVEVAWLAGYLEGEGSFLKGSPCKPNQPKITVETTDEDVAARVATLLGVTYRRLPAPVDKNWKDTYQVSKKGSGAVIVMQAILPYMSERRKGQIEAAIRSYAVLEHNANRKLGPAAVHEIRASKEPYRVLSQRFGIHVSSIGRIKQGKLYATL